MSGNSKNTDNIIADAASKVSGMTEEDKLFMSQDQTSDSGYISGGNILVSGEISGEILPLKEEESPESGVGNDFGKKIVAEQDYMRLDSGCDLTESLSNLCLQNPGLNDLSSTKKVSSPAAPKIEKAEQQPWEHYYEQDEDGDTYLHVAIMQGFPEVALALIRSARHPRLLDTINDDAQSPLHLAVATGQWKIARWLIVAGARPSPRNLRGDSPIHIASRNGDLFCCKAITDPVQQQEREALALSYPPQPYQPCVLDQWNYDGQTCVHVAAFNGHVDVLRHLVWYGADINAREGQGGYTALHIAIERGDERLVRFLLGECRKLKPETVTYGGRSVLQLGCPVPTPLADVLKQRGVASPYSSDEEYDSDSSEEEEMQYETQSMFIPKLVNASA